MSFPIARALAVAAVAAGALALTGSPAQAAYSATIQDRTLVVTGDAAGDTLALRAPATRLEIDVGDDGSADFRIRLARFDRIRVRAGVGVVRLSYRPSPAKP